MEFISSWMTSIPAFMAPLLLASLGLILCERSGVLNLGSEGIAAMGAMTGAVTVLAGNSPHTALIAGALSGVVMSIPLIIAVVVLRAPQILAGLAVVAIGLGGSAALGRDAAHNPFSGLKGSVFPEALIEIPLVGGFLFGQDYIVYGSVLLALGLSWFIASTHYGLRLRAVGEDPATADAAGVQVQLYQSAAVAAGCMLIGLAGAYLSVAGAQVWTEGMVAGRGWIALALVVFARWSPVNAIFGALLFGGADALIPRLQAIGLEVPVYLLAMLPYVLTIVVLVTVSIISPSNRSEPGFLGRAYVRQDR